ncbi:hypothetical protein G9A89_013408 [Geosiphon pyriformis]|nr:hypothetical protein G9A89_013408 [Geosiphon pyriformis]
MVPMVVPDLWTCQYVPLDYVRNDSFSGVMHKIGLDELFSVIKDLSDGKTAGLSGISNELWKHNSNEACSKFGVLCRDNFSVLKSTSTQSLVFAVGKTYDSVEWFYLRASLQHIKMCDKFIQFFGSIQKDRINYVITDFGLTKDYKVHDGLDQNEVFSPLLWRIFYNSLLCEVKQHKQLCGYYIDTKFVLRTGKIKSCDGLTSYFAAGAFVDDTIWIGNCQISTQFALNIASEFFEINDISINSNKTVAIPINQSVKVASLFICGQPISVVRKDEAYHYLDIFLSTKGLSKLSVAKAYSNVQFFVNVVLRKAITDKQFSYLMSAVLQSIVNYRIQFSFVLSGVCYKWDVMIRKGLKVKAKLSQDFPDTVLHHPSLYGLKTFKQIQFEAKVAALVFFSNASGILGHLFNHRFLDLQVLSWASLNPLQFPVKLHVSPVNNFLAGLVRILLDNELSLANNFPNAFHDSGQLLLSSILGKFLYFDSVHSLKHFGVAFGDRLFDKKGSRLNFCGPVPHWFVIASNHLLNPVISSSSSAKSVHSGFVDIMESNGSLKNTGSSSVASGAAAYFPALDHSVSVFVVGLLSSTMTKLQAIALSLECVLSSSNVILYLDSQAAIDAYVSELSSTVPDFCNQYWIKRHHIFNLVREKDLSVNWVKVKDHSRIHGNIEADLVAGKAT